MMALRHYTREELLHLRDSPLVHRPEQLPDIEQWIEEVPHPQQNATTQGKRQPHTKVGSEASTMGNFTTGQRPGLVPRASRTGAGDETGSRTPFASSRNVNRLSDFGERSGSTDPTTGEEQDGLRSRFFSDRQANRKSLHDKELDGARDSWTTVRDRRTTGREDIDVRDRTDRFGRRDREQDGDRRNGNEKHDTRWGEKRQNGDRVGGWRDRERQRREPEWMSGGGATEKNPEWMDDPIEAGGEDDLRTMGMSKRVEDFQKWKDERKMREMSGNHSEDAGGVGVEAPPPVKEIPKPSSSLKLEGIGDKPFGSWGEVKSGLQEGAGTPSKGAAAGTKAKSSRFASMFKDNQVKEEQPVAEVPTPKPGNGGFTGSAEDEAGFKRILQMLGNTNVQPSPGPEPPQSPQSKTATGGVRQKSRFTGFFDQTPKSPERIVSPQAAPQSLFRAADENIRDAREAPNDRQGAPFGGPLAGFQHHEEPSRNPTGPDAPSRGPMSPPNGSGHQRPTSSHINSAFQEHPPSRGAATPDINIQNLLAGQRSQRPQGPDKNSEFLLNLLQTKGSRPPSQQAPRDSNFPLWLDQPPQAPETHAPKPRAPPPPGLFEDQLLRNHPSEGQRPEQQSVPARDMSRNRQPQRPPPGFYDEHTMFLQQQQQQQQQQQAQRRSYAEPPPPQQQQQQPQPQQQQGRRIGNPPPPMQMQIPGSIGPFNGPPPPDFIQSPGGGLQQGPPPGFGPQIPRHPPGFHNIPNMFPGQQQPGLPGQPSSREGGMPPPPQAPPGFPGGGAGMMNANMPPPNAPPGFFAGAGVPGVPPGFLMQMRSPPDTPGGAMRGMPPRGYDGPGYDAAMGGQRH